MSVLVYLGCHNKILQTAWLKQQRLDIQNQGLADWVAGEGSLPGLQTATFSL